MIKIRKLIKEQFTVEPGAQAAQPQTGQAQATQPQVQTSDIKSGLPSLVTLPNFTAILQALKNDVSNVKVDQATKEKSLLFLFRAAGLQKQTLVNVANKM